MRAALELPISAKKLALLHVGKQKLALRDEDYRSILLLYGGVESAKNLTLLGFKKVLARFAMLGFASPNGLVIPMRTGNNDGTMPPSAAQLNYLDKLFFKVGFVEAGKQEAFCKRVIKKPIPAMKYEANVVIEALKKMAQRGYKTSGDDK
ncbi:MAG: phage protein GemA/Gp16 family protein [Acidaminococcaceae bacterium]